MLLWHPPSLQQFYTTFENFVADEREFKPCVFQILLFYPKLEYLCELVIQWSKKMVSFLVVWTGSKFGTIKRIHIQKFTHTRKCKPSKIYLLIYKCFNFNVLDTVSAQAIFFIAMELSRVTGTSQIYTLTFSNKS